MRRIKKEGKSQKAEGSRVFLPSAFYLLPFPWHWFILSATVPLIHCANRLNLDLWHDEIYTVDYFVSRGPGFIVSDYSAPNNHVLYSLVLWPFYLLSDVNLVLRLPSLLFTVGTLAIVFSIAARYGGLVAAVLSTSLLGMNQMFLIHTIQVRGYGLSMFLTAWLTSLALTEGPPSWRRWLAVVLVGAALLYVMPTNVLFFAPLAVVSVVVRSARRDTLGQIVVEAAAWLSATVTAIACYLPIANQVQAAAKSSSPSSWSYLPVIAANFFRPATHDYLWFAPLLVASLIALAWRRGGGEPRRWWLPMAGLGTVGGAFMLTAIFGISPFERNYCPLLVVLALTCGWQLAELIETVRTRMFAARSPSAAAVISLALTAILLCLQLSTYPRRLQERLAQTDPADPWLTDGYYCYYAANYRPSAVARYLLEARIEQPAYQVYYTHSDTWNLAYYFARAGLPPHGENGSVADRGEVIYAVLPNPPPWAKLAGDCGLSQVQLRAFVPAKDFGYYRLYQSAAVDAR